MVKRFSIIFIILFLSASNLWSVEKKFVAEVIRISDGDSIVVRLKSPCILFRSNQKIKVRLDDIDAPELGGKKGGQPFARKSREFLRNLLLGKVVTITYSKRDRYDRVLGHVFRNDLDVNAEMVRMGMAQVYFLSKNNNYRNLEKSAKTHGIGIWSLGSDYTPPQEYRRQQREARR